MLYRHRTVGGSALAAACIAVAVVAGSSRASAPPVGPLPSGPTSTIKTVQGELVSFALPHRTGGRTWRIVGSVNSKVLREVAEGDVGNQVVLVFKAVGPGTAAVVFALTRGERPKAYESRRFTVNVR